MKIYLILFASLLSVSCESKDSPENQPNITTDGQDSVVMEEEPIEDTTAVEAKLTLLATHPDIQDGVLVENGKVYTTCGGLIRKTSIGLYTDSDGFKILSNEFAGSIDIDSDNEYLYVTNYDDNTIKTYNKSTGEVNTITGELDGPAGIEMVGDFLYVTNFGAPPVYSGNTVMKIAKDGTKEVFLESSELLRPQGICELNPKTLIIASKANLYTLDLESKELKLIAETGLSVGNITIIEDVIYAAANKHNQILKITLDGDVESICCDDSDEKLTKPLGIDYDEENNRLIIAESQVGRLKALSLD
ncbi:MAG: hypothetical protein RLO81_13485 [Fulvivirga sp.]|uniref:hypothetical protein n=1 Tax=Fulvivirga sp. TaxID=1931237 RepID=UPI0032EE5D35